MSVKQPRVSLFGLGDCTHVGHSIHKDLNDYTERYSKCVLPTLCQSLGYPDTVSHMANELMSSYELRWSLDQVT